MISWDVRVFRIVSIRGILIRYQEDNCMDSGSGYSQIPIDTRVIEFNEARNKRIAEWCEGVRRS